MAEFLPEAARPSAWYYFQESMLDLLTHHQELLNVKFEQFGSLVFICSIRDLTTEFLTV